ncbi:MAG: DUF3108 domain-containing protein, partial [Flavobacteriaceae bacterium]
MKRGLVILTMLIGVLMNAQDTTDFVYTDSSQVENDSGADEKKKNIPVAFKPGEWLKFRIHYGILNASYATLHLTRDKINEEPVYH